ncbi:phosphatase PAP2 family protein [Caproiciproducens sp. CPB-2]|uniref:phosphatase PAP2 family protein n=1 Tax=Caproiciproducens sp. CPB-2 TaxID=3030017 RepID=UPI0023DC29BF|nr:phosphatase PAP2 family protein [Caproiciproducens sp. CPB-2]MDF1495395.1 phosphatase PAP2 family protein [Caproiciproducens sp. CPB-2]
MKLIDHLRKNKWVQQCERLIGRIRHLRPVFWVPVLVVALSFYVIFVPHTFWKSVWITIRGNTPLICMLFVFCLLLLSLVWSTGQSIDAYVFALFNRHGARPRWLDRTMLLLTELGNGIVTLIIALVLYFAVNAHLAYEFVLGTLTLWLVVELMKAVIRRPRPFIYLEDVRVVGIRARGKSFPSGHTSQAFYMATMLLQYFQGNFAAALVLYVLASLVGATRMYMGMHYPRDVLAGAILGTFWGFIGVLVNAVIFRLVS